MPILDAALAFSLTMLVVASVVSIMVNVIHGLLKSRKKRVKQMIKAFLQEELRPVANREMLRLSDQLAEEGKELVRQKADVLARFSDDELFCETHLNELADLTADDLKEQLKRSDLGGTLLDQLGNKAEPVFEEFASRYESVASRYARSFRNHTRAWTTGLAMLLAFGLNIDSIFILDSYLKNHTARDVIVGQMDQILARYDEGVAKSLAQLDENGEEAALGFKQAYATTKGEIDSLMGFGLPIGWEYFPHFKRDRPPIGLDLDVDVEVSVEVPIDATTSGSQPDGVAEAAVTSVETSSTSHAVQPTGSDEGPATTTETYVYEIDNVFTDRRLRNDPTDWIKWVLGVLLTGILAGVGAPFWYDIVTSISRVRKSGSKAQDA
tara:strand:- start:7244 stop:8386 length:1143 start_codon:yes stop_codon:yes gene_type:complete